MNRKIRYLVKTIRKRNKTTLTIYVYHKGKRYTTWSNINPNKLLSILGINYSGRDIIIYYDKE